MTEQQRWTVECLDAGDGSGDLVIELPESVCNAMRVKPGDTLIWSVSKRNGTITLRKKKESRKKSS